MFEASGREGMIDLDLHQVIPGSRAAGPARTVRCAQGDILMVHAAMDRLQPGDVLVLTMPEPRPIALLGELLATQAKGKGAAAMLVDAAVRDTEDLRELGLPVWARWIRVHGADQDRGRSASTSRSRSAARPSRRATPSFSTPTAWSWSARRGWTRSWRPRASGPSASASSAPSSRPASSPTTWTGCASGRGELNGESGRRLPGRLDAGDQDLRGAPVVIDCLRTTTASSRAGSMAAAAISDGRQ